MTTQTYEIGQGKFKNFAILRNKMRPRPVEGASRWDLFHNDERIAFCDLQPNQKDATIIKERDNLEAKAIRLFLTAYCGYGKFKRAPKVKPI